MESAHLEAILSQLVEDQTFRERFRTEGLSALDSDGLSHEQLSSLLAIDMEEFTRLIEEFDDPDQPAEAMRIVKLI